MHPRFRTILRRIIASSLYYSGVLWIYAAIRLHRRVVVLMYHRVLPAGTDSFSEEGIIISPETFSRHVRFLRRHFHVLSAADLADALENGKRLPSRGCVITFDDGWHDNFQHALPVLRREQAFATVFLASDYVGTDTCFWQERLTRRMFFALGNDKARPLVEAQTGSDVTREPALEGRRAVRSAVTRMKSWPSNEIAAFEHRLDRALQEAGQECSSNGEDRFMTWQQVAELRPPGPLTAGAHGCSHVPLTALSINDLRLELATARLRIEAAVGYPVDAIAYPNGDYDANVVAAAREAGYRLGFTTKRGLVAEQDDPMRLRRLNVHEVATHTMPEFLCLMLGIFHRWPRQV